MSEYVRNEKFVFKDKKIQTIEVNNVSTPWKVLVVDDEESVHALTRMVLANYIYNGKGVKMFSAYSGSEAIDILERETDIALILLDVVMETDDAGLLCAQRIRQTLKNNSVRIVLRTGQPGQAPEADVIIKYEINDYKEKSELTIQKLFTTVTTSLRDFSRIDSIAKSKKGLENIFNISTSLLQLNSFGNFASEVLQKVVSVLDFDDCFSCSNSSSLWAMQIFSGGKFFIKAASGVFLGLEDKELKKSVSEEVYTRVLKALDSGKSCFYKNSYVGYYQTQKGERNILYLEWERELTTTDKELISILSINLSAAYENLSMSNELSLTQREVIYTFSEVVEGRSLETRTHIRRVTENACILAENIGLSENNIEKLRLAVPMHDIGKVSTPDYILKKPGKLTDDEYEIMKQHTTVGYNIFQKSSLETMIDAGVVAYQHHEKWDGTGYPQGLAGEDIHIFARITALVDVFDALTSERCYKKAWSSEDALKLIKNESGKHFDPYLVEVFVKNFDEHKKHIEGVDC
ncbi:MAG: DUF3369 domain-containing protein [Spirochaetales bacterium]|nr:DUF3369 domain-containing protein [Spirochaetales bacterium]